MASPREMLPRSLAEEAHRLLRPMSEPALSRLNEKADATPIHRLVMGVLLCGFVYGAVMGGFAGVFGDRMYQVLFAGLKVPVLILATFALTLPSFYVINALLGLHKDFPLAVRAILAGQASLTIVLVSLAPFTVFWYFCDSSYQQTTLFNGLMFAIATFSAQWPLRRRYEPLIRHNRRHRWMLLTWVTLYIFVAIQMAWILRPFIGDPRRPVTFFREDTWGNAYLIVAKLIWEQRPW